MNHSQLGEKRRLIAAVPAMCQRTRHTPVQDQVATHHAGDGVTTATYGANSPARCLPPGRHRERRSRGGSGNACATARSGERRTCSPAGATHRITTHHHLRGPVNDAAPSRRGSLRPQYCVSHRRQPFRRLAKRRARRGYLPPGRRRNRCGHQVARRGMLEPLVPRARRSLLPAGSVSNSAPIRIRP